MARAGSVLLLLAALAALAVLNTANAESPVSVDVDSTNEGNYLISLRSAQTGSPVSDKGRKLLQSLFGSITQGVSSQSYGTIGATGSSGNIDQTTKSKANGKISIEYSSSSSDDSGN